MKISLVTEYVEAVQQLSAPDPEPEPGIVRTWAAREYRRARRTFLNLAFGGEFLPRGIA